MDKGTKSIITAARCSLISGAFVPHETDLNVDARAEAPFGEATIACLRPTSNFGGKRLIRRSETFRDGHGERSNQSC